MDEAKEIEVEMKNESALDEKFVTEMKYVKVKNDSDGSYKDVTIIYKQVRYINSESHISVKFWLDFVQNPPGYQSRQSGFYIKNFVKVS